MAINGDVNGDDFTAAVTRRDDGRVVVTMNHLAELTGDPLVDSGVRVVDATAVAVFDHPAPMKITSRSLDSREDALLRDLQRQAAKHADVLLTVANVADQMPVNEG